MTKDRRRASEQNVVKEAPEGTAPETQAMPDVVEKTIAPAAIERALSVYQQLQPRDQSVIVQARKILTQHIYGMVDRGERDEQRLTRRRARVPEGRRAGARHKIRSRSRGFVVGLTQARITR
jgi:hypothetical protein